MAPADWSERAETPLTLNPRDGLKNVMAVFKVLEMLVRVKFLHLPYVKDRMREELEVVPFVWR